MDTWWGVALTAATFNPAISACEKSHQWPTAQHILFAAAARCWEPSGVSWAATISACEKGGAWKEALRAFRSSTGTEEERTFQCSAAISAACHAGGVASWSTALKLLQCCQLLRIVATEVTFSSVLEAFTGQWEAAVQIIRGQCLLRSSMVAVNTAMKVCSFSGAPGAQKALLWLWASAEQLQPTAVTYSSLTAEGGYVASALRSQRDSVRLLASVLEKQVGEASERFGTNMSPQQMQALALQLWSSQTWDKEGCGPLSIAIGAASCAVAMARLARWHETHLYLTLTEFHVVDLSHRVACVEPMLLQTPQFWEILGYVEDEVQASLPHGIGHPCSLSLCPYGGSPDPVSCSCKQLYGEATQRLSERICIISTDPGEDRAKFPRRILALCCAAIQYQVGSCITSDASSPILLEDMPFHMAQVPPTPIIKPLEGGDMKLDDFLLPPPAVEPWEKSARGVYQVDLMQSLTMKFSATKMDYGASPGSSFESSGK
eukprot:s159_g23.t3